MAKTNFTATVTAKEGLTMDCRAREFQFNLDEPDFLGGNNTGMNPVEALLSALGACKAIVARSFAEAKGFKFTDLKIELEGTLDPDGFMGLNPEAKIGFSEIHTRYFFKTDESDERIKEFVDFMGHTFPVMDTICNAPKFSEEIVRL